MIQPTKRQKGDSITHKEEVLFNSDTLSKVISYLPSIDLLDLALTCKRFGISDDDEQSIIKMSADLLVQEIATEEQLAALPHYDGESSLADYHYLQLMREPLLFDQLVGAAEYVNSGDKSCIASNRTYSTAISNNIMRAGKHYVTFSIGAGNADTGYSSIGVMRPGQVNQGAHEIYETPLCRKFYDNFSRNTGHGERDSDSNVQCCFYCAGNGHCYSSSWNENGPPDFDSWDGMESIWYGEMGMLLDLDEGTLTVYKNGRELGVMRRGLVGEYCWVATLQKKGGQVTIKRGAILPS
jgi:hypothetical protein